MDKKKKVEEVELTEEQLSLQETITKRCFKFKDLADLFQHNDWDRSMLEFASDCLPMWLRNYHWPDAEEINQNEEGISEELMAITHLYTTFGGILVKQETISQAIRHGSFRASIYNAHLIGLFDIVLKQYGYTEQRVHTGEIRKGIAQWISRLTPPIKIDTPFNVVVLNLLEWWGNTMESLKPLYLDFSQTINWIIRINLESQFASGFSKKTIASLQTIFNGDIIINPIIFSIFRTLIPEFVNNSNLFETIEVILTKGDINRADKERKMELTLLDPKEYSQLSVNYRLCVADIYLNILTKLEIESEKSDNDYYLPSYFNRTENDPLDLMLILRQESIAWSTFLPWFYLEAPLATDETSKGDLFCYYFSLLTVINNLKI